ncbi:MAG: hypothetical protein IKX32_01925 [Bacteroidales bacterium]|nr:hypothetical protein [Bacteroidales bacterium]
MEKKLIIVLAVLLFAGVSANAQIGVTRNGRLTMPYYGIVGHNTFDKFTFGFIDSWDEPFPIYLPRTRSIMMTEKEIEYNHFTEEWELKDGQDFRYLIIFDTTGKIIESYLYELGINSEGIIYFNSEKGHNIFTYEDNRIVKITSIKSIGGEEFEEDLFVFKYDNNGNLVRILQNGEVVEEYRVTWYSQDYVSSITNYIKGDLHGSKKYQITKNGKTFVIKEMSHNTVYVDAHGIRTREDWNWGIVYYENSYDENGNLIKQLEYENKAAGKTYKSGRSYEYEYEFFD